jgi:hypothetical protein
MYVIRRVFKVKPGTTRKAAEIIWKMGKLYEGAGQRSPSQVYISGGSMPGPADTVYMEWTEETIQSPYREGLPNPEGMTDLYHQLWEIHVESYIEFYEMYHPPS